MKGTAEPSSALLTWKMASRSFRNGAAFFSGAAAMMALSVVGGELACQCVRLFRAPRSEQGLIADAQTEQDEAVQVLAVEQAQSLTVRVVACCAVCCTATSAAKQLLTQRMEKELRANNDARTLLLQQAITISEERWQQPRVLSAAIQRFLGNILSYLPEACH